MPKKKTLEQVITDFHIVHGDKYDYSLVTSETYINSTTKIPVICKEHGVFYVTPNKHIKRKFGCPICKGVKCSERKKNIPRPFCRTVKFGIGINDYQGCVSHGKNSIPSYTAWTQMLSRCYGEESKTNTYKDCTVCEEWLHFSNFKKWFDDPLNGYKDGYCLDKDILVKGNKLYSPETCCLVPNEINALLIKHDAKRGNYSIGVTCRNNTYTARVSRFKKDSIYLGGFHTEQDAFNAYKQAKEQYLKEMAQEYYDKGLITEKVYNALLNYKVEITD